MAVYGTLIDTRGKYSLPVLTQNWVKTNLILVKTRAEGK